MNDETIQILLQEAASQILEGIPPQETSTVSADFERLLTICIEKVYLIPSPQSDEEALGTGRYLIDEICKVPPEDRREHLQRELFIEKISVLNARAWNAAEKSLKQSPDLPALRAEARLILDQINELRHVLNAKGSDWEQSFERTLSEALGDCTFVLGESPYSSFRVGRTIRLLQDLGHWPPAWYAELWPEKNTES